MLTVAKYLTDANLLTGAKRNARDVCIGLH